MTEAKTACTKHRWGVFETEFSRHVMPCTLEGRVCPPHVPDADCSCEPLVDVASFETPIAIWRHNCLCPLCERARSVQNCTPEGN